MIKKTVIRKGVKIHVGQYCLHTEFRIKRIVKVCNVGLVGCTVHNGEKLVVVYTADLAPFNAQDVLGWYTHLTGPIEPLKSSMEEVKKAIEEPVGLLGFDWNNTHG